MTVTTTASSTTVQGNGSTTVFNYSFIIPSSNGSTTDQTFATLTFTDANGNQTVLTKTLWSMTGVGNAAGGTFTYSPAIASGTTLTLQRVLPYTQTTNLQNQSNFNASTVMGMDDYVTMLVQQLLTISNKSIQFPAVDSTSLNPILPAAASRAGLILGFDSNGNVQVSAGVPGPTGPAGTSYPIAAGGGTSDAITATFSPALTLSDKILCAVVATAANATTNPTFSPNSLTAHTITKRGGLALMPGDVPGALSIILLEYNLANTRWELINPATVQDPWVVAGGTADALTASFSPSLTALTDGLSVRVRAVNANATTTPTFIPNSIGSPLTITKKGGNPLVAGDIPGNLSELILTYNAANTRWELLNPSSTATVAAVASQTSFKNLKGIWASNTTATFTADQVLVMTSAFSPFLLTSYSQTLNTATSGAGGLDTGSTAASTWYYVYAIYNSGGATTSILMSTSATSPTMPSGYTFNARIGAIKLDGSKNIIGFLQYGRSTNFVLGNNLSTMPLITSGASGSTSTPTYTSFTVAANSGSSSFVPLTASQITLMGYVTAASIIGLIAPNSSYGAYGSGTNPAPITAAWSSGVGGAGFSGMKTNLILESTAIFYAAAGGSGVGVYCYGYEDNL